MGVVIQFGAAGQGERDVSSAAEHESCCMESSIDGLGRIVAQLELLVGQLDRVIAQFPDGEERDRLVSQRAGLVIKLYLAQRAVIEAERFARESFPL